MKHPLLEGLGEDYPVYLEQHHDHLLKKIEELWETPEIDDYLSDLLIDKRGGRKGFAPEATTCFAQAVRYWFGWIGQHSNRAMAAG